MAIFFSFSLIPVEVFYARYKTPSTRNASPMSHAAPDHSTYDF